MCVTYTRPYTFIGEPSTEAVENFAGFRTGQTYQLRYARADNGLVTIELDHLPGKRQLVVKAADFEKWWVRVV